MEWRAPKTRNGFFKPDGSFDWELHDRFTRRRERRKSIVLGAALILGVMALFAIGQLTRNRIHYPKQWSKRVAPLAAETEALRGLKFKHPVDVVGISDKEFDSQDVGDLGWRPVTEREGRGLYCSHTGLPPCLANPVAAVLRTLGIGGTSNNTTYPLSANGVFAIARFNSDSHRIEVRGKVNDIPNAVLVHELTHVLQEQHFGFHCKPCDVGDEVLAFRAVIEGDATRVEYEYRSKHSLTATERRRESATQAAFDKRVAEQLPEMAAKSPSIRPGIDYANFPYEEGLDFVNAVLESGGNEALAAWLVHPPKSSAQILTKVVKNVRPKHPSEPHAPNAYNLLGRPIGAWYWREAFLVRGDDRAALAITHAWNGESAVMYYDEGTEAVCFTSHLALTGSSAKLAADSLEKFAATFAAGKSERKSDGITVGGCERSLIVGTDTSELVAQSKSSDPFARLAAAEALARRARSTMRQATPRATVSSRAKKETKVKSHSLRTPYNAKASELCLYLGVTDDVVYSGQDSPSTSWAKDHAQLYWKPTAFKRDDDDSTRFAGLGEDLLRSSPLTIVIPSVTDKVGSDQQPQMQLTAYVHRKERFLKVEFEPSAIESLTIGQRSFGDSFLKVHCLVVVIGDNDGSLTLQLSDKPEERIDLAPLFNQRLTTLGVRR